jgi:hypothetical protein
VVVLVAGGAALEVRAHPRDSIICVCTLQLELYVLVDFLEALVAEQFGLGRAEQSFEGVVIHALVHDPYSLDRVKREAFLGEVGAQLSPCIVKCLVERSACRAEPLGQHVERYAVERERHQHFALVLSQAAVD